MQAYFSFLKQAGQHLDPKTAALISVITKVHAKTPKGLRQYLPRALKAGASADEVIDALLMAMPALGFSKIVWAIEVIIEMDLPEFRKYQGAAPQEHSWTELGKIDAFPDNATALHRHNDRSLYIRRAAMEFQIYDARCPHKRNLIPETGLADDSLTCPFHEWKFDLATGRCTAGGDTPLKQVQSKVSNGSLYALL